MKIEQLSALVRYVDAISMFDLLGQDKPPKVVFTTQRDNKVDDKICIELAGLEFDINDPLRPIIPDDTHPNCRCYYVDKDTGQVVTDISSERIKDRGMPSKKLNDKEREEYLLKNRKYLTHKKLDLITDTMKDNEKWQKNIEGYPYKDASLELIGKWLKSL